MPLRRLSLPHDLDIISDITHKMFQYPENEEWSIQKDEAEEMVESTKTLKRLWPLIRFAMLLSPQLKDMMRGYLWEEDGQVVGTSMVQRRGTTDKWMIVNVGVLPEYRRRGLARKMVEACNQLIREQGGRKAILDVIDGNVPAVELYKSMGFEQFSGNVDFDLTPGSIPPEPVLPSGYITAPMHDRDWEPRFKMDQRISPESLSRFEPVEIGRYRPPAMVLMLNPVILAFQKLMTRDIGIFLADGTLVGRGGYAVPKRAKGVCSLYARTDPAHPQVAAYLVQWALHHAATLGQGKRIEASSVYWQTDAIAALEAQGFKRRRAFLRMGLELE